MDLRLMNDYGVYLPLWVEDGLMAEDLVDLPPDLEIGLRAWATNFNENFEVEGGWPSRDMERAHRAESERLLRDLREALPSDQITLHYWEKSHH